MDLPRSGDQQIGAPDHMGDALPGVVHHHRQLVGKVAVGPADHEIADLLGQILRLLPQNTVPEPQWLIEGPKPQAASFMPRHQSTAAGAGIDGALDALARNQGDRLSGAAAGVGQIIPDQPLQGIRIGLGAPALVDDFVIPFEAESLQGAQDMVGGAWNLAGLPLAGAEVALLGLRSEDDPVAVAVTTVAVRGAYFFEMLGR